MTVVNSMVGQKGVVMKMKLSYNIANQTHNFEEKISNFPANVWSHIPQNYLLLQILNDAMMKDDFHHKWMQLSCQR